MNDNETLSFVSSYRDMRPKGNKKFLISASLVLHAVVVTALVVVPLTEVSDLPEVEAMTAFIVREPAPPPPPPAPPQAARREVARPARAVLQNASFVAPVEIPSAIQAEDMGLGDFGLGGVEGGVPGGVVGGIVGGLPETPPPPQPTEPVRLNFAREEAKPVIRVEPVYPELAAQARVQGVVILEVLVDQAGVPSQITVLRSVPMLEAAALDAVEQWRWMPYELLDQPTPFWVTVTVTFRLT